MRRGTGGGSLPRFAFSSATCQPFFQIKTTPSPSMIIIQHPIPNICMSASLLPFVPLCSFVLPLRGEAFRPILFFLKGQLFIPLLSCISRSLPQSLTFSLHARVSGISHVIWSNSLAVDCVIDLITSWFMWWLWVCMFCLGRWAHHGMGWYSWDAYMSCSTIILGARVNLG